MSPQQNLSLARNAMTIPAFNAQSCFADAKPFMHRRYHAWLGDQGGVCSEFGISID